MTSECCAVDRIGFDPLTFGPLGSLSGVNPGGENNNVVPPTLVTSGCCRARALAEVEGYSWIPTVSTGKSFSEALIYFSINPKYSIALLGRFPLIIHQNYISRTLVERQLYTDCFAYLAQMNVAICTIYSLFLEYFKV